MSDPNWREAFKKRQSMIEQQNESMEVKKKMLKSQNLNVMLPLGKGTDEDLSPTTKLYKNKDLVTHFKKNILTF